MENSLSVAVAASFWVFLAALPPFRIGIWIDSESVLIASHVIFVVIGFCLSVLWIVKNNLFCSSHTVIFLSFSIVSSLATLWVRSPIVHHLGVPLLGEGSVLFFGLSILSFGLDNAPRDRFIHWSAISAGFVAGILVFLHHPLYGLNINPDWLPYVFGAFLAPIALGIYTITALSKSKIGYASIFLISIILLFLSHNKTAWVAVIAVSCFWFLTKKIKNGYYLQKFLCASIPLLSVIAIYFLGNWPVFSTLESRKLAIKSYVLAWRSQPLSLLFGNGWGSYFENLQKQITSLPVEFFHDHAWKPSWDGVERLDFHCMHLGVESLFSLGILGLILYVILILAPFTQQAYKKNSFSVFLFTVLFGCLTSTWFTLVCVWPFFILGFSVLNQQKIIIYRAPLTILWLSVSTVLCVHAVITYWQTAALYPASKQSLFFRFTHSKTFPTLKEVQKIYNYNGFHLGHSTLNTLKRVNRVPLQTVTAELNLMFRVYNAKTSPLVLDVAMLHGMEYFQGADDEKQNLWKNIANAILEKAPKRSDLLVPYVNELIEAYKLDQAKSFITLMFNNNPNDPFALWLEGIYHIRKENVKHGKSLMLKALDKGIEKWIYIPKNLKNQLAEIPQL